MTPFGRNTFIFLQKILSFNWSGKHASRVAQHCLFNWIHKWHCECHKFWQIAKATWKNRGKSIFRKQPLRFALKRWKESEDPAESWDGGYWNGSRSRGISRQELGQCEALLAVSFWPIRACTAAKCTREKLCVTIKLKRLRSVRHPFDSLFRRRCSFRVHSQGWRVEAGTGA